MGEVVKQLVEMDEEEDGLVRSHVDAAVDAHMAASFREQEVALAAQYNQSRYEASVALAGAIATFNTGDSGGSATDLKSKTLADLLTSPEHARLLDAFTGSIAPDISLSKTLTPNPTLHKLSRFVQGCAVAFPKPTFGKR